MPDPECWNCDNEYPGDRDTAPYCSAYCRGQHRARRGKGPLARPKSYTHKPEKPAPSRIRALNGVMMGRCQRCDADLWVQEDGWLFCSNGRCKHARSPHPTTSRVNEGVEGMAA